MRRQSLGDEEIHQRLLEHRARARAVAAQRRAEHAAKLKSLVRKLRADGLDDPEIRKTLEAIEKRVREEHEKANPKKKKTL